MHQPNEESDVSRILVVKLSNGETVVGTVTKETSGYIELTDPYKLVMMLNKSGNMNLTIMKWDMTIDFDYPVRVFKNTIVACGKPNDKMVETYREIVENGFDVSEEGDGSLEDDLDTIESKLKEILKNSKGTIH